MKRLFVYVALAVGLTVLALFIRVHMATVMFPLDVDPWAVIFACGGVGWIAFGLWTLARPEGLRKLWLQSRYERISALILRAPWLVRVYALFWLLAGALLIWAGLHAWPHNPLGL